MLIMLHGRGQAPTGGFPSTNAAISAGNVSSTPLRAAAAATIARVLSQW